jgi:hypothetical protein
MRVIVMGSSTCVSQAERMNGGASSMVLCASSLASRRVRAIAREPISMTRGRRRVRASVDGESLLDEALESDSDDVAIMISSGCRL